MRKNSKEPSPLGIRAGVLEYLQHKPYMVALILTAIGSYGFLLTHYSVSMDDLSMYRYYEGGQWLAIGRITSHIVCTVFPYLYDHTCLGDYVSIVALCFAAILFCILIDQWVQTKSKLPQIFFSCLFVSYPLHSELFCYSGLSIAFSGGSVLMALSMFMMGRFLQERRMRDMMVSILCLTLAASWFESTLQIYVALVFAMLLLRQLASDAPESFKSFLQRGALYALPLVVAIMIEWVVSNALIQYLQLTRDASSQNGIFWSFTSFSSFLEQVALLWTDMKRASLVYMFFRLPVALYVIAFFIMLILAVIHGFQYKNLALVCAYLGLLVSTFALALVQAGPMPLRASQVYAFLIGFVAFLLVFLLSKGEGKGWRRFAYQAVSAGLSLLIFVQVVNIDYWFELDYKRYEQERRTVEEIGFVLNREYDVSKPVVFTGDYALSTYISERRQVTIARDSRIVSLLEAIPALEEPSAFLREHRTSLIDVPDTIVTSYIRWSSFAFNDPYEELIRFFEYCGIDGISNGTAEQYQAAQAIAKDMPPWPVEGSIRDCGEFLIVNFGE